MIRNVCGGERAEFVESNLKSNHRLAVRRYRLDHLATPHPTLLSHRSYGQNEKGGQDMSERLNSNNNKLL
jgi:hypothetical protein